MSALEKRLDAEIMTYAKRKGAWAQKIHGNEFVQGVPDILICYRGHFLAFESKAAEGRLRALQVVNLREINAAQGIGLSVRNIERVKDAFASIDAKLDSSV